MRYHLPLLTAVAAVALLAGPSFAADDTDNTVVESSPGKGTVTRTRQVVATVTEIDAATRQVTIKGPNGHSLPLQASPEVRNLDKVAVGDRVVVKYRESLSLELKKEGGAPRASTDTGDVTRSKPGDRPGGEAVARTEVTADVIAVDAKRQTVTLKGPQETAELWVKDPKQFGLIKVGDQVHAVYTRALAVSMQPAAPAKK